jgi:hypothetical protein
MDTIRARAAAVTGARHLRAGRNGQDAAAAWVGEDAAAVVVCDGCSGGPGSEVGARLGARVALGAIARHAHLPWQPLWHAVLGDVLGAIAAFADRVSDDRHAAIHEHWLFTIVAAAALRGEVAVWAVGDGAYAIDGVTRTLGPFADNQPPYLAYALVGAQPEPHVEIAHARSVVIASDGAAELGLARFADRRFLDHPDALRRELACAARGEERVDWHDRRIVRVPAALQDDGAVGVMAW